MVTKTGGYTNKTLERLRTGWVRSPTCAAAAPLRRALACVRGTRGQRIGNDSIELDAGPRHRKMAVEADGDTQQPQSLSSRRATPAVGAAVAPVRGRVLQRSWIGLII